MGNSETGSFALGETPNRPRFYLVLRDRKKEKGRKEKKSETRPIRVESTAEDLAVDASRLPLVPRFPSPSPFFPFSLSRRCATKANDFPTRASGDPTRLRLNILVRHLCVCVSYLEATARRQRSVQTHSRAAAFPPGVCNEREYITNFSTSSRGRERKGEGAGEEGGEELARERERVETSYYTVKLESSTERA